jgi:DNA-3-methyladenine glycosylase II
LHALQRPDVFSYDDLVIRRSLISIHQLTALSRADFEVYRERYSPYCSVAMIYLWRYGAGG